MTHTATLGPAVHSAQTAEAPKHSAGCLLEDLFLKTVIPWMFPIHGCFCLFVFCLPWILRKTFESCSTYLHVSKCLGLLRWFIR